MIVLSIEDKLNCLEQPIPPAPVVPAGQHIAPEILAAHNAWIKGSKEIIGIMLMTMEPKIQRNLETLHAHEMLLELKTLFAQQAEQELLQTTQDFHSCKQEEGQSVGSLGKTINELHAILKLHEQTLPKNNAHALHVIQAGKIPQRTQSIMSVVRQDIGRGCLQYLAELLKKKKNAALGAGGPGERKTRKGQNQIKTEQKTGSDLGIFKGVFGLGQLLGVGLNLLLIIIIFLLLAFGVDAVEKIKEKHQVKVTTARAMLMLLG
nr:zinc finger, CCHC-type [Tanacetum cinerariifolium]